MNGPVDFWSVKGVNVCAPKWEYYEWVSSEKNTDEKDTVSKKQPQKYEQILERKNTQGEWVPTFLVNYIIFFSEDMLNRKDFPVLAKKLK